METISMAWALAPLLAGEKTVTRRAWTKRYANRFKTNKLLAVYTRRPDWGGKHAATIKLTEDPYVEMTDQIPLTDFIAEGFLYMMEHGLLVNKKNPLDFWNDWHADPKPLYTVRFELVSLVQDEVGT